MRNYSAFKAYDIRWQYKEEIDENLVFVLWKAFAKYFVTKYWNDGKMLISSDTRFHNNSLIRYFCAWLELWNFKNFYFANLESSDTNPNPSLKNDFGVCSTSASYRIAQSDFDIGVCFTASHNPATDVGMKFFDKNTVFLQTSFLRELFDTEISHHQDLPPYPSIEPKSHPLVQTKLKKYSDFLLDKYANLSDFSFCVDFCNGAGVTFEKDFFEKLSQKLGRKYTFHNHYPDGNFPDHDSETQDARNYQNIINNIKSKNLDFGVMFDGDVDRIWIVTNAWNIIPWDIITAIVSKQILQENKKNPSDKNPIVIYDVMSSKIISDVVSSSGGKPLVNKMWRFFMNETLNRQDAIFGWECSGHYFLWNYGGYEMPLLVLYYVLLEAQECGNFEAMYGKYKKYYKSPVIDIKVSDKDEALTKIKKEFAKYNPQEIDGVNIYSDEFWLTVRKSNTSDKIRYSVESSSESKVDEILDKIKKIL